MQSDTHSTVLIPCLTASAEGGCPLPPLGLLTLYSIKSSNFCNYCTLGPIFRHILLYNEDREAQL
jgi:hypothetical protein